MKKLFLILWVSLFLSSTGLSHSDTILPGDDHFKTVSSFFDFSLIPIPDGFFGPGSEPFSGGVKLKGVDLGMGDTIIRRSPPFGLDDVPSFGVVPIELVAMNLVSANPITVTYSNGTTQSWDVRLSVGSGNASGMNVSHDVPDGGTFDSLLPINPILEFTSSGNTIIDTTRRDYLPFQNSWSHTKPNLVLAGPNNFFPGGIPGNPNGLNIITLNGGQLHSDIILTTVPEPASIFLMAGGCGLLIFFRRRFRKNIALNNAIAQPKLQ